MKKQTYDLVLQCTCASGLIVNHVGRLEQCPLCFGKGKIVIENVSDDEIKKVLQKP